MVIIISINDSIETSLSERRALGEASGGLFSKIVLKMI